MGKGKYMCLFQQPARSFSSHTLNTTLTLDQELLVVELRRMLLLSMDDLLAINNP